MVLCTSGAPHKQDGPWAWLVLACVFMTGWLSGGVGYSFGVYLPVLMEEFNETRDKAALVGSLQFATFLCLIAVSSQLCERYGCRLICAIGHVISATGFVLSSLPRSIIPLYFSHSLFTAFGSSCIQGSGYLIIGLYFKKHRSLAIGFVASAVGAGAICWGPLAQFLLGFMSWRNIFRLIAGLYVALCFLTIFFDPNVEKDGQERERNVEGRSFFRSMFDLSIWRGPIYATAVLSNMIASFGHHTATIHVVKFALELGVSASEASSLFVFFGSTSVIARIAVGKLCDIKWIKPIYLNQAAEITSGVSTILLTQARSYPGLIVFSIFYGIADGTFRTTLNVLLMNSVGPKRMASAFGQGNMMISFFAASGPALAGKSTMDSQ
ncbi:predicted protein [Nematostella vectensis]|uniref:Major facilitator superfamily (MFS) profile domain-containing protein n=1 Tax=Nematostella vectensis TaxID=45351 RepID=A7S7Z3_NEMVE|nr:predicted protein [Nematostella vectensis]|eukprot:XP_001632269.1 predicted protein [Nematostella vectensis]